MRKAIGLKNRKERKELVEHLLAKKADGGNLPKIPQVRAARVLL